MSQASTTRQRMLLNDVLRASVLITITVWTALQLVGAGAVEGFGLWGIGRATAVLELLLAVFVLMNPSSFSRVSRTTAVVIAWIPWVVLNVTLSVRGDFADWILSGPCQVLLWPLVYLFAYTLIRAAPVSMNRLTHYFGALSLLCVVLFFATFVTVNVGRTAGFQQLNAVYYPLLTLPWIAVARRPAWRALGAVLIVIAVSYSLKRTALVALAGAGLAYALVEMRKRTKASRVHVAARVLAVIAIACLAYVQVNAALGDAFSERLVSAQEDGGSERLAIYAAVIQAVQNANARELILGHGHGSSLEKFGITAHNDFLEVIYGYGVVGLLLYCLLHAAVLRTALVLSRQRSRYAAGFAVSYVLFLAMSMTSHLIIYPTYFAFLVALWGAVEGGLQNVGVRGCPGTA